MSYDGDPKLVNSSASGAEKQRVEMDGRESSGEHAEGGSAAGNQSPSLDREAPTPNAAGNQPPQCGRDVPIPNTAGNQPPSRIRENPTPMVTGIQPPPFATEVPIPITAGNQPPPCATEASIPHTVGKQPPPCATEASIPHTAGNQPPSCATKASIPNTAGNQPPSCATKASIPHNAGNEPPPCDKESPTPMVMGNQPSSYATTPPTLIVMGNANSQPPLSANGANIPTSVSEAGNKAPSLASEDFTPTPVVVAEHHFESSLWGKEGGTNNDTPSFVPTGGVIYKPENAPMGTYSDIPGQYLRLISEDSETAAHSNDGRHSRSTFIQKMSSLQGKFGPRAKSYQRLEGADDSSASERVCGAECLAEIETRSVASPFIESSLHTQHAKPDEDEEKQNIDDVRVAGRSDSVQVCFNAEGGNQSPRLVSTEGGNQSPRLVYMEGGNQSPRLDSFEPLAMDPGACQNLEPLLLGVDDSSVDGSQMSDSDDNDLEDMDVESLDRLGNGSTDTDIDCAGDDVQPGPTTKAAPQAANLARDHVVEKLAQVPPIMVYYTQIRREFHWHRLYLNHHENVDFSVFEFGKRREYLVWRAACLVAVLAVHVCTYFLNRSALYPNADVGHELCIHTWLGWLLLAQLSLEVTVLSVQYWVYPTCYLARVHSTPLYWKVVWCLNNVIAPNLYACCFMFAFVFAGGNAAPGTLGSTVHAILNLLCLANTSLGAMPIRLAHCLHPLLVTFTFIVYVNLTLPCSSAPNLIDPKLHQRPVADYLRPEELLTLQPCYLEPIMWHAGSVSSVVFSFLWLTVTMCSHIALVILCWCRRVVFRGRRERSVPVYGQSPETHFFSEHGAEVSPHMIRLCEQDGFEAEGYIPSYPLSPPYNKESVRRRKGSDQTGFML